MFDKLYSDLLTYKRILNHQFKDHVIRANIAKMNNLHIKSLGNNRYANSGHKNNNNRIA